MKFLFVVGKNLKEITERIIPEKYFERAYIAPTKTFIVVNVEDEKDIVRLAQRLDAEAYPVVEITKLGEVVYEKGVRKVLY